MDWKFIMQRIWLPCSSMSLLLQNLDQRLVKVLIVVRFSWEHETRPQRQIALGLGVEGAEGTEYAIKQRGTALHLCSNV